MASLTMIKWCVEGNDLVAEVGADVAAIENSDLNTRIEGWEALTTFALSDPEFVDIMHSSYAHAGTYLTNVSNACENYLKSITISVEAFDGNGDTALMNGNSQATMWDFVTGDSSDFSVTYSWCHSYFGGDDSDDFCANWGSIPEQTLDYHESHDRYGMILEAWGTRKANGTASQWAPFIHTQNDNPSALNQAILHC